MVRKQNADIASSFTVDGHVAGTWSASSGAGPAGATGTEALLEIVPSVRVPDAARTELTEEAERLVRFVAPEAGRYGVRWRS